MKQAIKAISLLLILLLSHPLHAERLLQIDTPRGAKLNAALIETPAPKAAVILFAGGHGALNLRAQGNGVAFAWGKRNFLIRTREQLAAHGLMIVSVDAPDDRQGRKGMLGGFRSSQAHVDDIDALIAQLRQIADVPVWLVGTSRGTESAANIAIASQQAPAGLVLTSSMTDGDAKGQAVLDMALEQIRIPTLITHHRDDGCRKTRPERVDEIAARLTQAAPVELKWFSGGREQSKPCKAMSHHGYLGIEDEVVDAMAAFILANS